MSPKRGKKSQGLLQQIDIFGTTKGFLIEGADKHKTKIGGCLSLIVYVLFLVYSGVRARDFVNRGDTVYRSRVVENTLDTEKVFTNEDLGT